MVVRRACHPRADRLLVPETGKALRLDQRRVASGRLDVVRVTCHVHPVAECVPQASVLTCPVQALDVTDTLQCANALLEEHRELRQAPEMLRQWMLQVIHPEDIPCEHGLAWGPWRSRLVDQHVVHQTSDESVVVSRSDVIQERFERLPRANVAEEARHLPKREQEGLVRCPCLPHRTQLDISKWRMPQCRIVERGHETLCAFHTRVIEKVNGVKQGDGLVTQSGNAVEVLLARRLSHSHQGLEHNQSPFEALCDGVLRISVDLPP